MPRRKSKKDEIPKKDEQQNSQNKKSKNLEKDIEKDVEDIDDLDIEIEDKEKRVEEYEDKEDEDEVLNIDDLSDLEDLDDLDEFSIDQEIQNEDYFVSEDDFVICPNCGEVIEVERLKLLEECPSCGLKASEFEQADNYDFTEKEEDEEW